MSEDAPVNTGAVEWPHPDTAYFMVRSMQAKLHCWAAGDPRRRFGDLFNLVYDPAFLVHAWERVATNRGARTAGIDRAANIQVPGRMAVFVLTSGGVAGGVQVCRPAERVVLLTKGRL
jgi:RNA-directed DNA polymerase